MFMIKEYIENKNLKLTNTKHTAIVLGKDGASFFKAHLKNKERYKRLVDTYTTTFVLEIIYTVRQLGMTRLAVKL